MPPSLLQLLLIKKQNDSPNKCLIAESNFIHIAHHTEAETHARHQASNSSVNANSGQCCGHCHHHISGKAKSVRLLLLCAVEFFMMVIKNIKNGVAPAMRTTLREQPPLQRQHVAAASKRQSGQIINNTMCTAEHKLRLKQLNAIQLIIAGVVGAKRQLYGSNSRANFDSTHYEKIQKRKEQHKNKHEESIWHNKALASK